MKELKDKKSKRKNKWIATLGLVFIIGTVTKLYLSYRVRAIDGIEGIIEGSSDEVIIMPK